MELCLGTVQFGMSYGIRGQRQPEFSDTMKMLDYATQNGINTIDTANAYGTAEDLIGQFLSKKTISRDNLFLISKLQPNVLDNCNEEQYYSIIKDNVERSLYRLHTDYLDSYLLHSSRYVFNDKILDALNKLKQEGYARSVGVSVYETHEAQRCIESSKVDFMQLPYSIFDQRMDKERVFEYAKGKGIIIHSRSAFIQGLILMQENEVPSFLKKAKPIVRKITELCDKYQISRIALAMSYVKMQAGISHLVFGVDNIEQLKEDISLFEYSIPKDIIMEISKEFDDIDADIVMPSLWKKE